MKSFTVEFADGSKCNVDQAINMKELQLGDYKTSSITAQVINLQRYDAILGKPWLYHANPLVDWRNNTITFKYGNKTIKVNASTARMNSQCNSVFILWQQFAAASADASVVHFRCPRHIWRTWTYWDIVQRPRPPCVRACDCRRTVSAWSVLDTDILGTLSNVRVRGVPTNRISYTSVFFNNAATIHIIRPIHYQNQGKTQ